MAAVTLAAVVEAAVSTGAAVFLVAATMAEGTATAAITVGADRVRCTAAAGPEQWAGVRHRHAVSAEQEVGQEIHPMAGAGVV